MQQDIVCAVWLGRRAVLIKMEKVSPLWWPCPPYRIYRVFMACKCPVAMCMHTHCPFACAMPSGQCWKVCSLGASMSHLIVQLSTLAPRIQQLSPEHTNRCLWVVTVCVCVGGYTGTLKRYSDTRVTLNMSECNFIKWASVNKCCLRFSQN